jgi:uncharacterized membrane protein
VREIRGLKSCALERNQMNSAFYIIFVPVLLVMLGYIVVFRSMGLSPGYPRLVIAVLVFAGAFYWLGRRVAHRGSSGGN